MAYTVSGGAGKRRVKFACSRCDAELESPLEEAGHKFPCPRCAVEFTTPGAAELEQQRRAIAAAKARRDAEQKAAEQLARRAPGPQPAPMPLAYAAPSRAVDPAPDYTDILRGTQLLRLFAGIAFAVGIISVALGMVLLALNLYGAANNPRLSLFPGLIGLGASVAYALPCFIVAVMLRLCGALAIAVRDMARNSFSR